MALYVKLWEMWPGKNIILFDGRLMTGPNMGYLLATMLLIVVPFGIWYEICFDWMMAHDLWFWAYLSIQCLILCLVLLCLVAFTEPGTIPRRQVSEAQFAGIVAPEGPEFEALADPYAGSAAANYCPTCELHRPPRASHCNECDNCVLRFDHHCYLLNNCIGIRNYLFFLGFIVVTAIFSFLIIGSVLMFATHEEPTKRVVLGHGGVVVSTGGESDERPSFAKSALMVFIFTTVLCSVVVLSFMLLLLVIYHLVLLCRGRTTKEDLKRERLHALARPTSCMEYFRRPKSMVHLRLRVAMGQSRREPADRMREDPPLAASSSSSTAAVTGLTESNKGHYYTPLKN